MDSESERTRKLGCWDVGLIMSPSIQMLTSSEPTPDYAAVDEQVDPVVDIGLGKNVSVEERQFWRKRIKDNYLGDEGRRRSRMASINLRDRDSLLGRLADVRCPVLWMHVSREV